MDSDAPEDSAAHSALDVRGRAGVPARAERVLDEVEHPDIEPLLREDLQERVDGSGSGGDAVAHGSGVVQTDLEREGLVLLGLRLEVLDPEATPAILGFMMREAVVARAVIVATGEFGQAA